MNETRVVTEREVVITRAMTLARGYIPRADAETMTAVARELFDADRNRTAVDIAYLLVKGFTVGGGVVVVVGPKPEQQSLDFARPMGAHKGGA